MRVAMRSKVMQNESVGRLPEYGAIFMSNSVTKKECLRQKLFALPSAYGHFVKHVKVGMILFLFEYERRELHGVFQAISDGRIDIDPHAFIKYGKHCPAQVKFKSLWVCNPLTEDEFHDAIKENYFTGNKFSFGLSESQVQNLLYLFSSKVIRVPEQQLTTNGKAKLVVRSTEGVRRIDSSHKSNLQDRLNGGHAFVYNDMDMDRREAMITGYSLMDKVERNHSTCQISEVERVPNDGGFVMNDRFQDKYNQVSGLELRSSASNEYPWRDEQTNHKLLFSGKERSDYCPITQPSSSIGELSMYGCGDGQRERFEGALMTNYDFQNMYNKDTGVQSKNSSSFQSKLGGASFVGVANSLVSDQTIAKPPSWSHHEMDSQLLSNLPSKTSYRDAVVTRTHPINSSVPSFPDYQYLSSNEVILPSTTSEGYKLNYGCSDVSTSTQQQSLSYPSQSGVRGAQDIISRVGHNAAFSGTNHIENAYGGAGMSLSEVACSQNVKADSIKNQFSDGLASSKFSLGEIPSLGSRILGNENMISANAINTNTYPSSLDNYGYQNLEDQLRFEAAQRKEIRKSFMANRTSEFEDPFKFVGHVPYDDPQYPQHYEHNSLEYDPEHYQLPDSYMKRTSVFSRLASASDGCPTVRKATVSYMVGDMQTSINGIMKMLHKSQQLWVKQKKLQMSRKDDEEKQKLKIPTAFCGIDMASSQRLSADIEPDCSLAGLDGIVDCSLAVMDQAIQSTEKRFLNFKRRSEKQKLHNNGITIVSDANSTPGSVPGGQQRKRKLVRPNFSNNASSDNSDMQGWISNLQSPIKVSYISDKMEDCEASLRKPDDQKTEGSVIPDQGVSVTKRGGTRQRRTKPIGVEAKAGKKSSNNHVSVESDTITGQCEDKISENLKDANCSGATAEGSLLDCNITTDSLVQVLKIELPKTGIENANGFGEGEFERKNEADLPTSALSIDEICINSATCDSINKINSSTDEVPEIQMEGKEHLTTGEDTIHGPAKKHSEGTVEEPKLTLEMAEKRRKLKR